MEWSTEVEQGLAVLPPDYRPLLGRARTVFEADERVRGMWLHGAIARGALDHGGDLDIDIAVRDEDFEAVASTWTEWLARITPTVSAIPVPGLPGSCYALTPTCERMDVIVESVSATSSSGLTRRLVIFDRDGLTEHLPPIADPVPDRGLMRHLIEETLRQAANFNTVMVREDWLLGVVAVQQVHQHLYLLFSEANKPQPPTGPKQWSFKLSERHRVMLEGLPVPQPEPASILEARAAALSLLVTEGRRVAEQHGVEWPNDLAAAVLSYLDRIGYPIVGA
jgi:hypothetical protein